MSLSIELQVSLGLQLAESLASKLRELLKSSVKIDTSAFKSLNNALTGAEKQIALLKSLMNSAFLTAGGSKKFLHDYDKLFESLSAIGSRFDFLKEADIIFSPESSAELKNMRSELELLDGKIKWIKAGKIGNLFDDSSVDSIKEVLEVAESMKVTLSKTTFSEFGLKLAGKMAETKTLIEDLRKLAELLDQAVNNTSLSKNSIFSLMSMEKLMGNTSEVIDKDSARTLREKISSLYELYGLTDVELGKTIKAGSNIDLIFVAEEERVRQSSDKYVKVLEEQKQKIQDELNKFDEGLKLSGGDGKRANWETKLAYIDEIKQKFSGLLTFSEVPASVRKDGTGITKYVELFKQELAEGIKNLNVSDITKELLEKVRNIINGASTKSVITDASTFKTLVETILKDSFGGLDLKGVTDEIKNGMNIEDAIDRILVNVKNKILSNGSAKALNDEADKLQAAYDKMARAGSTVKGVEASENAALKENEAAFVSLTQKVLDYVAAKLGLTSSQVALILNDESGAINKGRTALEQYIESLNKLEGKLKTLSNVQSAVTRWMGFYQVLNLTKRAINDMKLHILELDTVMTQIAVVTNMSQELLWGQIGKYSQIARQYGVAIKGVYEVSLIYYQLGLESNDVMTLTTETLKMARIAGLDYATAADYMTTAIRGFKLEMTDAAHVTDVFSALAASTASSTEELAVAISKTAASAANVGSSFEATSAMMATMIATTRESATNIGTALKSIISRYGEMKGKPEGIDAEGEEYSLNKVDKALLTIGVSIHTVTGEFRNFDDVILELAEKWDTLDSVSQRYIATIMAGNRQQSRFLALVSNVDEYKRALEVALGSEDSGLLQMLKTLDSVDAKLEKMKVTIQEFYTSSGLEQLYKNIIDTITNIISTANRLPKAFNKIPIAAVAMGASIISAIKSAILVILSEILAGLELMKGNTQSAMSGIISLMAKGGRESGEAYRRELEAAMNGSASGKAGLSKVGVATSTILRYAGAALSLYGSSLVLSGMSAYGASTERKEDEAAAKQVRTGGILGILGSAASGAATGTLIGGPGWGTAIGGLVGAAKGVIENIATLTSANEMYNVTLAREIELSLKRLDTAKENELKAKDSEKTLELAYTKLKELELHLYDSVEALLEYYDYMNLLADSYPAYVEKIDLANNAIIYSSKLEELLAVARETSAGATIKAIEAELETATLLLKSIKNFKTGLTGLYDENTNISLLDLTELVRTIDAGRVGFMGDKFSPLRVAEIIGGTDLEAAAEYLVKAYASTYVGDEIAHYNRKTGKTEMSPFGTYYTYQGILNLKDKNGLTLLDKIMTSDKLGSLESPYSFTAAQELRVKFSDLLDNLLEEGEKTGLDYSLATITNNEKIKDLQDILELNDTDFLAAVSSAKKWAEELTDVTDNTTKGIKESLTNAKVREKVTSKINDIDNKLNKLLAELYKDLISYGLSALFKDKNIDEISDEEFDAAFDNLSSWIKNNKLAADTLANIDFSKYFSILELINDIENFDKLDTSILTKIKDDFDEARKNALDLYESLVKEIFGDKIPQFLERSTVESGLNNRTITALLSDLSAYLKLLDKLLYASAAAYLNNIQSIYTAIGDTEKGLTGDEQTLIFSLIKDLDLSDPEALYSVADTLTDMGGNFANIAPVFTEAALRWAVSAATLVEQLSNSAKDTAKTIETSIDEMGKTFKYSEALEKALTLINANKDEELEFEDLYQWDDVAKGYIKTAKAFLLEMNALLSELYEAIKLSISDNENILPQFEKFNQNIKDQYLKDIKNESIEGDRSRFAKKLFDSILKQINPKATNADLDRLWVEYTLMIDAFEAQEEEGKKDWDEFIKEYLESRGSELSKLLEKIQNMPQDMAKLALLSFDYKDIVSGKGTELNKLLLQSLITSAAPENATFDFEELWGYLITGQFEKYNDSLRSINLSGYGIDKSEANRTYLEGLKNLYTKLEDKNEVLWDSLTEDELIILLSVDENLGSDSSATDIANAADSVWAAIIKLIRAGAGTLEEVADNVSSRANKAYGGTAKEKSYQLLDKYKDGLTAEELQDLLGNQELFINTETGKLTAEASKYLTYDNGKFIAKAGLDAASVLQFLANTLGFAISKNTDEYKETIHSAVAEEINKADKADIGKLRVTNWLAIMSANVGDRLDISEFDDTTKYLLQRAGLIAKDVDAATVNWILIQSEQSLNNAIDWMKLWLLSDTNIKGSPQTARYFSSMVRDLEEKTAKNAAFEGIVGETVSQSAANALSMALLNTTEYADVLRLMQDMGFKWNQAALVWKASAESIEAARLKIQQSWDANEIDNETYLNLMASLDETANAINPKTKLDNVILDMLLNYTNASEAMRAAFVNNFYQYGAAATDIFKANDNGTYDIDVAELKSFLDSIGFEYDEAAMAQILAITDSYLSNISTALNYAISGASSLADIETFKLSYADIVGETLDENAFGYNTALQSFVLDPSVMNKYVDKLKELLFNMGYTEEFVNAYIEDQTESIIQASIELDGFLNANTSKLKNDEANKLITSIRNLNNYKDLLKGLDTKTASQYFRQDDWSDYINRDIPLITKQYDLAILSILESGGQAAVDLLKQIKPDASLEEFEAVFNSLINKLNDVMSQVGDLVAGLFVGTEGKLYEVLRRAGAVDGNGVVLAGFSMVDVYAAIYAEMTKTVGVTTAGLNDAYAKLLTAQDLTNIDITEALKNGNSMSYADFGNLLAKYDIKFKDYMTEHWNTIIRDGFGNIRITDWEGFAKNVFKTDNLDAIRNTDEYISAFKAYNDGLIELNKKTEKTIKDEILQISNAKAGDQLNLSYLWTALLNVIDNATKNIAPENYSGNVDLANRPIVPAEKMKQVFENFEDDYATLYSESFIFGDEFGENAGVLFTTLTASGEIVKDLADYVLQLYDEADGNLDYMSELDSERRNLMLYGKRNTSYEELGEYANDIHIRAAAKDDINYYLKALQAVGANYADGILTISEDADMIAIGDILSILSDLSGVDLGEEGRAAIKDAVDDLLKNIASLISNGAKGSLTNSDAATLSQWYRSTAKDYGAVMDELNFTETAEGLKLTETSLANVYDLMKRIDGIKASALLDDIISTRESFLTLTGALREFNDAMRLDGISEGTNKLKGLNGALSNTAKMMQDVVLKAMTSPDSMNFMSNKLPDDMLTAVNAWENASKAIKTITAAEKSGYMGVQDFYNIVNTASSLMVAAGKEFQVAGKDAATLLKEGADNVKVVDGKLTVDISSAGLNIVGSADLLKLNMATGINELADAEIAIIDAEILVLEILAAMEQMSDMDVDIDNDGLSFEIKDIFDDLGNFTEGENSMKAYLEKLQKIVGTEGEIADAFRNFKIGTTSLYDLIHGTADEWVKVFGSQENVAKFMQKFSKGMEGWDLEGNLQLQVLEFMKGLGLDYSIDLGDSGIFHVNASGISYVIDFNDEERMGAAREAAESVGLKIGETDEEFKSYLKLLAERGNTEGGKTSELSFDQNYVLKVATGQIEVVKDKKTGKELYKVGGKLYNNKSIANAAAELILAGAEADWDELSKREVDLGDKETIPGKLKINNATVNVETDGKGNLTYRHDNYTGKSLEELYTNWFEGENQDKGWTREGHGLEFKEWQVKLGISVEPVFNIGGKEGNAKTNLELRDTIQKAIDNGIQEGKVNPNGKAYEVKIDDVTVTIPKENINLKDGLSLEDAIQEYLRDNYNTVDLDLRDTIAAGITKAFNDLKDSIKDLDSKPLTEIAGALEQIISSIKQLADEKGVEKLNEEIGKVDTEALTSVGEALKTISTNLQTLATSGNWLIVTVALGLISTALSSINENSGVFETIQSGIDNLGGDQLLQTVKDTLEKIRDALKEIKENSNIPITIDASGADNALSTLEKIAKLLSKLTGKDFGLGDEGGEGETGGGEGDEGVSAENNLPENNSETVDISGSNVIGTAEGGNVEAETTNIEGSKVEGTAEGEAKVPATLELSSDGMPELPETKLPVSPEVEDTKIEESGTAKLTPELDGEIPEQNSTAHFTADVEDVQDLNATAHYTAVTTGLPGDLHLTAYYTVKMLGSVKAAEGNVGLAQGIFGQAKAKGTPTLMGELGPELVVQDGHYFVAGLQGAEMVPLTKDAIVFNHLLTDSLLKKGMSKGRGRAVTNERNAVSFATGNVGGGPAMASASAALALLKALRAMWESLKKAKVSDLAGAGGGGGGGGGGKDDSPQIVDPRTWIATVERWYNLTLEIAKLEKEITYQQLIREKILSDWLKDGRAYYASLKKSLSALKDLIDAQEQLNVSRQEYYNKRIAALKEDKFGQIYTFDEEGQLKFNKNANLTLGDKTYTNAMEWYTDLVGFDNDKGANYTNKEKYEMLVANGFASYMKYDENGQEIKMDSDNDGEIKDEERESYYENATKAFKDKLDDFAEATQSLWDEIQEGNKTLEELETTRNELLKEMRDNQMELENKVLDAIVESRQREIDALQDLRDALEESVGKYIDGLSDALDKELLMYETQEAQDELNRNKRRLAILQRSGGSVSDINSLLSEISEQERSLYFDAQQAQIDAILEASDKEIERLDNQIELMTEQLEFLKQYGLLWNDVYTIMDRSALYITDFINGKSEEYWSASPLSNAEKVNETLFLAESWKSYAADLHVIAEETRAQLLARDYAIFDLAMKAEYGADYDSTGKWKERFEEVYADAEQGGRSETLTRKLLLNDIANEAYIRSKLKLAAEHGVSYIGTGEWSYKSIDDNQHYAYHYENKTGQWTYVNRRKENHEWSGQTCKKCGHAKPAPANNGGSGGGGGSNAGCSCSGTCSGRCGETCRLNVNANHNGTSGTVVRPNNKLSIGSSGEYRKSASGGFVSHGLYELGERGTETVLTAQQTQVLRNNILSNRPSSLISLLKTYNEGFSRMESPLTGTTTEDNSVTIENASVNMNVQQISNDYDARRAGEQAMNEMMRIARKTSAANSIRR